MQSIRNNGLINGFFNKIPLNTDVIQEYSRLLQSGRSAQEAFALSAANADSRTRAFLESARDSQLTVAQVNEKLQQTTVSARLGRIALSGFSMALNIGVMTLVSIAISALSQKIYDTIHASEIARENSSRLTQAWQQENSLIQSSISQYEKLRQQLTDTSLNTSELMAAKEQLASVQQNLISQFGDEAKGIDLVNGKYEEQISKLGDLTRASAQAYVAENAQNINDVKDYLGNKVGTTTGLDFKVSILGNNTPFSIDGVNFEDYVKKYDSLSLSVDTSQSPTRTFGEMQLRTLGTRAETYQDLVQLFHDLDQEFGDSNEAINDFKENISSLLTDSFDKDEIASARQQMEEYTRALILADDTASDLYLSAVEAVERYNHALFSGTGIEEAKADLESVKETIQNTAIGIEGSDKIFDQVFQSVAQLSSETKKSSHTLANGDFASISSLLRPGLDSMKAVMDSLKSGSFDSSLLYDQTFSDTFSNMGESYSNFIKILSSSPEDIETCQKAAGSLLNTWISSSVDLADASAADIKQLMKLAESAGISSSYLARLQLAKWAVNDAKINTSSDIAQIIALANTAMVSSEYIKEMERAKSLLETVETSKASGSAGNFHMLEEASQIASTANEKILAGELSQYKPLNPNDFMTDFSPSSSSAAPSSASRGPQDFDRTDRALQLLKDRRSQLEEMASDSYRSYLGSGPDAVQSILEQMMYYDGEILKKTKADNIQAFEAYQKALAKVPEQYRDLIEHPGEGLETLDPDTADSVEAAAEAYDEYQKTFSDIADIQKQVQDDKEQYYNVSLEQLDRENQAIESQNSLLNARIDLLTASGSVVGASLYESLIDNTDRQIGLAQAKLKAAREKMANLDEAEGSEKAYDLQEEIAQAEESLASFQKVKEEYDKKLLELPIDNLDTVISMYEGIASSIQDWGSSLEASGQKLGASYYQSLIDNGRDMLDQYQDQADLIEEVMDRSGYDPGSENWNELYDRLQSVNSAMSSMVKNLREWNEALLSLPLDSLSSFSDSVKDISDALSDLQSDYDSVISTVTGSIQDEIDRLKEENDAASETYENKIQLLQEQIDLFDKTNEKRQKELAVEQALYDLEQARGQKTTRVIRDGQITYEADADEIRAAEESLAGAKEDLERYQLQEELDGLQEELDSVSETYDAQIEKLEDMAEKWDSIRTDAQGVRDAALTESYLGSGWKETILSGNGDPLYDSFSRMYGQLDQQLADYEEQLASSQHISSLLEAYITSYKEGVISYEAALSGIQDLLSQMNQALFAGDMLENVLALAGAVQGAGTGAAASSPEALTPSSILESLKASFESSGKQLLASLAQYNENAGMITEYTTSWEQLTDNVASMKDILEDVRDNLEESLEELSDRRYDEEEEIEDDRDEGVTGTVYERPSHNSDATTGPGIGLSYGDGILNGAVGQAGTSDPVSRLKELATRSLSQDEIPIIAHRGEAVLNRAQQEMLLKNFSLALAPLSPLRLPDYSFLPAASSGDNIKDVHISISGVDVHGVKDVNDFIHSMASLSAQAFRQEFNRMF